MMEAQVQAMAAQSVPPLGKFCGEDFNTEEGSFDHWIEGFEERAKITGWSEEQRLFQLKAHLEKTAEHAVRMLPTKENSKYDSIVAVPLSGHRGTPRTGISPAHAGQANCGGDWYSSAEIGPKGFSTKQPEGV